MGSNALFEDASSILVGGVNSPVRAFKSVGGHPVFIKSGQGPYVSTEDDTQLIDYIGAFGPHILGHGRPEIKEALHQAIELGLSFGAPTQLETVLAHEVQKAFPSIDKIRFVNSGTEACMGALRVARGFTKRDIVLKFNGCYHGHADSLLVAAGSGNLTFGQLDSAGVPESFVTHTAVIDYNDIDALTEFFITYGHQTAAVIIEPVVGNMGVVVPQQEFLTTLRHLCTTFGSVLIFDEVMTGFRVAFGGAQSLYGITPDLTCLGKIIGGGLPCGAFGGRQDIMDCLSPLGPVYQAGTLSGNPLVMSAGLAMLKLLSDPNVYTQLERSSEELEVGVKALSDETGIPIQVNRVGSMFSMFFTDTSVTDLPSAKTSDTARFARFHSSLLKSGVMIPPSQFEAWFISHAHSKVEITSTLDAIARFLKNGC
jgi:glutamate-1-semialdehyde 2,1-aminomutase